MSDAAQLVVAVATLLGSVTSLVVAMKGLAQARQSNLKADIAATKVLETDRKVENYHHEVNSRMDELVSAEKSISKAEGVEVGRIDERQRRREQTEYDRGEQVRDIKSAADLAIDTHEKVVEIHDQIIHTPEEPQEPQP